MKLLSVIASMDPVSGGPAQGIRNNIFFWKEYGLAATVVSLDNPHQSFVKNEHIVALGPANNKWAYTPRLLPWLLENLSSYDAVLVHGLWLYNGYAVYSAFKQIEKSGKKVPKLYVMSHGMLDPYFQKAKNRQLKAIRNSIYWHLIEKKLINKADAILFTCEEELQLAKITFSDYHPKATFNLGYGILEPPAYSIEQKLAFQSSCPDIANRPYLLFISRIHPKKGVDILLDAYKQIIIKYSGQKATPLLVIAGPGLETGYGKLLLGKVKV